MRRKKTGFICVECGSPYANKGSSKHPFCKKCFDKYFSNFEQYRKYMSNRHVFGLPPQDPANPDKLTRILGSMKLVLWQWGFYPNKCPYCGSDLMEHGFPPNSIWTCTGHENCIFNEDYNKWLKEFKERTK